MATTRSPGSRSPLLGAGPDEQRVVAIEHAAGVRDQHRAVGVAVERDAGVGAGGPDALGELARMR